MKKKKKKKKDKPHVEIRTFRVGENMVRPEPMFKPKHTKKPIQKLYRSIRNFMRALAKRRAELGALNKVPIASIDIKFSFPDDVLFPKSKKLKQKSRKFVSGNVEIEQDQVLGAWKYDTQLNAKVHHVPELAIKRKKKKKKQRKEEN